MKCSLFEMDGSQNYKGYKIISASPIIERLTDGRRADRFMRYSLLLDRDFDTLINVLVCLKCGECLDITFSAKDNIRRLECNTCANYYEEKE